MECSTMSFEDINLCNILHLVCIIEQEIIIEDSDSKPRKKRKTQKKLRKIKCLACFNTNIDKI